MAEIIVQLFTTQKISKINLTVLINLIMIHRMPHFYTIATYPIIILIEMIMNKTIQFSTENIYAILDQSPIANLLVDTHGNIVYCNKSASIIFQYTTDELQSLSVEQLIPHDFRPIHIQHRKEFEQSPSPRKMGGNRELFALRKDESLVPVEVGLNPILIDQINYVMASIMDITERKKAVDERLQLEQQLQQAQKLESLGILAGGIAHDFNNILMGIMGNTSLILEDLSKDHPLRLPLEQVQKGTQKATNLTRQLLAYAGKGTVNIMPVDISEVVKEILGLLEVSISKGISIKLNLSTSLPTIMVDTTQLTQVIMNLITNASEAIEDGNGIISLSTSIKHCDEEYVEAMGFKGKLDPGTYVCLEIADTGKGMDDITREKIFDPFFTTKFTGRGLGLSAVQGIVRTHGGCIAVYSEVGRGTSFKILLPTGTLENDSRVSIGSRKNNNSSLALIIDDDDVVMSSIKLMAEKMGIKVLTASNGKEGLQFFEMYHREIEIVILDFIMPEMNGDEVLKKMQEINNQVKVLLISGYNENTVDFSIMEHQTAGFLQKPFSYPEFKSLVEDILSSN